MLNYLLSLRNKKETYGGGGGGSEPFQRFSGEDVWFLGVKVDFVFS